MKRLCSSFLAIVLAAAAFPADALPGTFAIDQVYSSADGNVQFVTVIDHGASDCDAGENRWQGLLMISAGPEAPRTFVFPADLPTCKTSGRRILIATQGFAALGLVTPDFVIPNGFLQHPKGRVSVADAAVLTYAALPDDGVNALDGDGNVVPNRATNLAGASVTVTTLPPPALDMNQHGMTGSWYESATSGQGVEIEIFPDLGGPGKGYTQVSWFTYDTVVGGADRQRWYTLSGDVVSGKSPAVLTLYLNTGGNFNAGPATAPQIVGSATLSFGSCTSGQIDYTFSDGSGRTGSIALTRLAQNMTCAASSPPTHPDFALSGNWYDPATSGQGITVEVNPASNVLFFAWYTYANGGAALGAAGQRWYTGQAGYTAGTRSIALTLYESTGGAFDIPTNPAPTTVAVGTGTLAFQSCANATLAYNFTGGSSTGKSGSINLVRIGPVPKGCAN